MKDRLEKYLAKSSKIKIYLDTPSENDEYSGIPIRLSRSLVAIHDIREFHFDGIRVIRLKDIVKVRRSNVEIVGQKILKSTGEMENHFSPSWLRIGSWKSLLTCLKTQRKCVCIERSIVARNSFVMGYIYSLKDKAVILKSFDTDLEWNKPMHSIEYSDITEIYFDDEYSVTYSNFVKNQ